MEDLLRSGGASPLMVSGGWAAWGPWSSCSRDCELGFRFRKRTCTNPEPRNGGLPCVGDAAEYQDCNPHACPGNPPPRNLAQGTPRPGNSQAYPGLSSSVETTPPRPLCTQGPRAISLALKMDRAATPRDQTFPHPLCCCFLFPNGLAREGA